MFIQNKRIFMNNNAYLDEFPSLIYVSVGAETLWSFVLFVVHVDDCELRNYAGPGRNGVA